MNERPVRIPFDELLVYPPSYPNILVTQEGYSLISETARNPIVGRRGNSRELVVQPENSGYKISDSLYFGDIEIDITCVGGEGIAFVQKFAKDKNDQPIPDKLDDFQAFPIGVGTVKAIPKDYFVAFVNTGKDGLVVRDDSPEKIKTLQPHQLPDLARSNLIIEKGFLYSVLMKNSELWLSRNLSFQGAKREIITGVKIVEMD